MRCSIPQQARRDGFATIVAVGMLAVVAVAALCLAAVSRAELRRTRDTAGNAQLRQMLLAGTTWATARVDSASAGKHAVTLPDHLAADAGLHVTFDRTRPPERAATVRAVIEDRWIEQRLVFTRREPGLSWSLARVSDLQHEAPVHTKQRLGIQ